MLHDSPIPYRPYRGFYSDRARLPPEVRERLDTFIDLVTFDPDDDGFLASCELHNPGSIRRRKYAYWLLDNYIVYWRVVREEIGFFDLITLKELKPLYIDILQLKQVWPKW